MSIYSLSVRSPIALTSTPILEIFTSSTVSARMFDIMITPYIGGNTSLALGRPQTQGVLGPTQTPNIFIAEEDFGDPQSKTKVVTSWDIAPTIPASFLRCAFMIGSVGYGLSWTFPRGLHIPVSTSLVLWCVFGASARFDIGMVIDE